MNLEKTLAYYICRHDGRFCFTGTVIESKGYVALSTGIGDFDELDLRQIRLLSELCTLDEYRTLDFIAQIFNEEQVVVAEDLDILCQFGFAEEEYSGYKASLKGRKIIFELVKEVMKFDKLKYKQNLGEIENLEKHLLCTRQFL